MKRNNVANAVESSTSKSYTIEYDGLRANVRIVKAEGETIYTYLLEVPKFYAATNAFIDDMKASLLKKVSISPQEVLNLKMMEELRKKFFNMSKGMILAAMPHLPEKDAHALSGRIVQEMLGLGDIEFLLRDNQVEEICVNGSQFPLWIYHRKYGWVKSNLYVPTESQIWNYSSSIARGVGRQINTQSPLLDAYLPTGDRVNATLIPISYFGNTITIRKFARKPWTITDYIKLKTISSEVAALLWLAIQYEANIVVSGGTGAGKTSMLNVFSMFIPQNHRIVSIEQTREITLPSYMQWVPLVVREPTSEGTGQVSMLDLMVNSLRMRPDRIIVGEIRRAEEAQVLFEAMHTGHSVYATFHAETVSETLRRFTNPPINAPSVMMESLNLIVAMYRDRRSGIRRVFEVGEILPADGGAVRENILYRWRASKDALVETGKSVRILEILKMYTNMDSSDIARDVKEKQGILDWFVRNDINSVEEVGNVISRYYDDPSKVLKMVQGK